MTRLRAALALIGAAFFAYLFLEVDGSALVTQLAAIGVAGFGIILLLYAFEFLIDVMAWQLVLGAPGGGRRHRYWAWIARLYGVRMAGESINVLTPLGGFGGEPVKAVICQRHYGIEVSRASASLVLALTLNVLSLVGFLAVGFALMLDDPRIDPGLRSSALLGLGALTVGVLGFVAVQRIGIARVLGVVRSPRLRRMLDALDAFDRHLQAGYAKQRGRFVASLVLNMMTWLLGVVALMVTLSLMGREVSFADAWVIEALTQMVRAATFVIPASIGAQEGILVFSLATLTGDPALGLAVALVRRAREVLWVAAGAGMTWRYLGSLTGTPRADHPIK